MKMWSSLWVQVIVVLGLVREESYLSEEGLEIFLVREMLYIQNHCHRELLLLYQPCMPHSLNFLQQNGRQPIRIILYCLFKWFKKSTQTNNGSTQVCKDLFCSRVLRKLWISGWNIKYFIHYLIHLIDAIFLCCFHVLCCCWLNEKTSLDPILYLKTFFISDLPWA